MHSGRNLLMCIGFFGKMTDNSNTRFKLQIKDVVEVMGNKGIKLIKPIKINPEEYAGLEWKLGDFKEKEALIPDAHLIYTNSKGEPSIRFTDYNYEAQKDLEEESIIEEMPLTGMNIEVILEEDYAVDLAIEKAKEICKNNKNRLFTCKGCKLKDLNLEQTISHFKICEQRTDNKGYRLEKNLQDKLEKSNNIMTQIQDDNSEISELESILSQKELMETTSSSSPFQRTNEQGYTADNSTGNIPRRRLYRQGDTPIIEVKPMGKRMPIEEPIILQEGGSKGKILNIAAHDPQR